LRYKICLLSIVFFFSACGNEDVFTCKDYAQQNAYIYLDTNLSPIQKGKIYIVEKNLAWIEPVQSLADIKFELSSVELSMGHKCVKLEQDENDTHKAQIIFK